MVGVFGPGEVYSRTLDTLASDPNPTRRAYAAYAVGEFLVTPGIAACATALQADADPGVRAAAASALGRLNDDGAGALGGAMSDAVSSVKIAALTSAGRINSFTGVASVAGLTGDGDPLVRRRALEILDSYRAKDSVAAVLALAKGDGDVRVRIAACHALGSFGDASVISALQAIGQNDASTLVRDQANIALRRL
jgi:HEAT repeat protein